MQQGGLNCDGTKGEFSFVLLMIYLSPESEIAIVSNLFSNFQIFKLGNNSRRKREEKGS